MLRASLFSTLLLLGLGSPAQATDGEAVMAFKLESSAFAQNGVIPRRYTCEGDNISPPLAFTGVPKDTKSLALIVDDPDAPDPDSPQMTWVHWVLFNIPPATDGLPENVTQLPKGTAEGLNDWQKTGYGGPCPPVGRHRYFHKLYALDTVLSLSKPTKAALEQAMQGHVLAQVTLVGTYKKGDK